LKNPWDEYADVAGAHNQLGHYTVKTNTTGSMKTLIEGLFPKDRLLDYVRNFIVHEVINERITKKGAKYHQFFAVRFAVQKALEAMQPGSDKRVGVVWHTQGSGKSLSMIFLTGILRRWPGLNPIEGRSDCQ
jgi:type I restriction enzyme, R subunit